MERKKSSLYLVLVVLILSALACQTSFSTANIADAWMSLDIEGDNRTSTYSDDDIFYAQVDLRNAPDDTLVKVAWIAVDAEEIEPNFVINEYEYIGGDSQLYFELENTGSLWPLGEYRVDIYLNETLDRSVTFFVQ